MRLNWFLPHRREGELGPLRRFLRRLGPSWPASPVRRLVQGVCLGGFLWLFLVVCWPYTARPARVLSGWQPLEVDAQSGQIALAGEPLSAAAVAPGDTWHVVDTSVTENGYLGTFRVVEASADRVELTSQGPISSAAQDRMLTSFGPWSLHEREPAAWAAHYAEDLAAKETLPAELLLALDPLVSLSTAIAGRTWVWSLGFAGVLLAVCLLVPRGFCGYVCPLGTTIDLFDWALKKGSGAFFAKHPAGRSGKRLLTPFSTGNGWWVHLKYYLLAGVLVAAACGVLVSGFVAAIPVITRAMAFVVTPLQTGFERGWHQVPPQGAGQAVSIGLFAMVLALGLLAPRFWCKYVCPSGAVFSLCNVLRLTDRKVSADCIRCNRCRNACSFDAIKPDFTTRGSDCTFCQECGGVCPPGAIRFTGRWHSAGLKDKDDPPTGETAIGRRGFVSAAVGLVAGCLGGGVSAIVIRRTNSRTDSAGATPPVRPPGSVPEPQFLQLCIRCGECFQACPNDVLQAQGNREGPDGLWAPEVVADHAGCEPSCNRCGQVCPTGAIRALPIEEKRAARMGLAVVDPETCLPYAGQEDCQLCVDECTVAGYRAIEFIRVGTQVDELGLPIEGSGHLAPVVLPDQCVGCGLCQTRCFVVNVAQRGLLDKSAIVIEAGPGKEDRLTHGSYIELRKSREQARQAEQQQRHEASDDAGYLPDFLD